MTSYVYFYVAYSRLTSLDTSNVKLKNATHCTSYTSKSFEIIRINYLMIEISRIRYVSTALIPSPHGARRREKNINNWLLVLVSSSKTYNTK